MSIFCNEKSNQKRFERDVEFPSQALSLTTKWYDRWRPVWDYTGVVLLKFYDTSGIIAWRRRTSAKCRKRMQLGNFLLLTLGARNSFFC